MARVSRMVLLAAIAFGAFWILGTTWPRFHRVEVRLPQRDGGVVGLHVEFTDGSEVLRAFDRRFSGAAPRRVRLGVRLADGEYDVLLRTEVRAGPMRERSERVTVGGDVVPVLEAE